MRIRPESLPSFAVFFFLAASVPAQTITEFALPDGDHTPSHIAAGPEGNLWFTETSLSGRVGRITPTGVITEFSLPSIGDFATPISIAAGPDGNLWYTRLDLDFAFSRIGRITAAGVATEFPLGSLLPEDIVAGPDGNLWITTRRFRPAARIRSAGSPPVARSRRFLCPVGR
jgi:virginiamycin B lyase